jgi:integrase
LLGSWRSKESKAEYAKVIGEWLANGRRFAQAAPLPATDISIAELILAFWNHAERHYRRPDGSHTSALGIFKLALKPLRLMYADLPASRFGPLHLKVVRQRMLEGEADRPKPCRNTINKYIAHIRIVFNWAVGEGMVPPMVLFGMKAVSPLQAGRCDARESEPVKPVQGAFVDAIREYVLPPVWTMIELQGLTGMRPGEVVRMRACDIDMSGDVWTYKPAEHKMSYRGRERIICLGPQAQAIVRPYLQLDTQAYLFSPRRAMEERRIALRSKRQSKVQPSQLDRKKANPKRQPNGRYTTSGYGHAVRRACRAANVPEWSPNQLRHSRATELRKRFGVEAARVALGHSDGTLTAEVYAEQDHGLALKIAAECG